MPNAKELVRAVEAEHTDQVLEWMEGTRPLHKVDIYALLECMKDGGLVVRLTKTNGEQIDVTIHSGDLSQVKKVPGEEPSKGFGMWKPEFKDYLHSGKYAVKLIPYQDSHFTEAELDAQALGSDSI